MHLVRSVYLLPRTVFKNNVHLLRKIANLSNQQQVTIPSQGTLTGRILLYLNSDKHEIPNSRKDSELLKNVRQNFNYVQKLNISELINFLSSLNDQSLTKRDRLQLLNKLDNECYYRLPQMKSNEILKLLNMFMEIILSEIVKLQFYKDAIKVLSNSLNGLDKKSLLQFIFYVGLQKKSLESQNILRRCLRKMDGKFINSLSGEELCIICNSTFKCSTKLINKQLLIKIRDYINQNLSVLKDSALFVTLVKTLRHNRFQDDDLLNTISCTMFFNKTFNLYSFPMTCHILALFADYFYYDENLFHFLIQKSLGELNQSHFASKRVHLTEQLRGKDIKRFLWILSMFSEMKLVSHGDIKNVIVPKIVERIKGGEFVDDVMSLVDILLFLWMLNYQPLEIVPYVLNDQYRTVIAQSKNNLRLNLLLHLISVENENLYKNLPKVNSIHHSNYETSFQLNKREQLQRLLTNLEVIKKELGFNRFELNRTVPTLNIIGIAGYNEKLEKTVYIELLDDYTRLRNLDEDVPVGLMALKIRLLDQTEQGVLVVSKRDIEEMNDSELRNYLLNELKLIC